MFVLTSRGGSDGKPSRYVQSVNALLAPLGEADDQLAGQLGAVADASGLASATVAAAALATAVARAQGAAAVLEPSSSEARLKSLLHVALRRNMEYADAVRRASGTMASIAGSCGRS